MKNPQAQDFRTLALEVKDEPRRKALLLAANLEETFATGGSSAGHDEIIHILSGIFICLHKIHPAKAKNTFAELLFITINAIEEALPECR